MATEIKLVMVRPGEYKTEDGRFRITYRVLVTGKYSKRARAKRTPGYTILDWDPEMCRKAREGWGDHDGFRLDRSPRYLKDVPARIQEHLDQLAKAAA